MFEFDEQLTVLVACILWNGMRIFHLMAPGAVVLFIDNSVGDIKHVMTRIAIQYDMDPIFGPINHEDYINECVKVFRFGHSSCFKTKIAIQVWMKPFNSCNSERNWRPLIENRKTSQIQNTNFKEKNIYDFRNSSQDAKFRKKPIQMIENTPLNFNNSFNHLPFDESFSTPYSETPKDFRDKSQETISVNFNTSHSEFIPLYPETPQKFTVNNLPAIESTPMKFHSPLLKPNHSSPLIRNVNTNLNHFRSPQNRVNILEQSKLLQNSFNSNFSDDINETADHNSTFYDDENSHYLDKDYRINDLSHSDSKYWSSPRSHMKETGSISPRYASHCSNGNLRIKVSSPSNQLDSGYWSTPQSDAKENKSVSHLSYASRNTSRDDNTNFHYSSHDINHSSPVSHSSYWRKPLSDVENSSASDSNFNAFPSPEVPVWDNGIRKLFSKNIDSEQSTHWRNMNRQVNHRTICNSEEERFNYFKTSQYSENLDVENITFQKNIDLEHNTHWNRKINYSFNDHEDCRFNPYRKVLYRNESSISNDYEEKNCCNYLSKHSRKYNSKVR